MNEIPANLSGQKVESPINLDTPRFLDLACSLAKVDGALHLSRDCKLQNFACLLDGNTIPGEDRSRGARYNSALRFTAENPNFIVVVVSSDRPVSVIQKGMKLRSTDDTENTQCMIRPMTLEAWAQGAQEAMSPNHLVQSLH